MRIFAKIKNIKSKWFSIVKWVLTILIVILVISDGDKFFKEVSIGKALHLLRNIPNNKIFSYIVLGILAVSLTSLYDFVWYKFNSRKISKKDIFQIAFIANTINNIAGFGGLGGAAIRYVFYRNEDTDDKVIIKMNLLLLPTFFTGLSILMWFNIFRFRDIKNIERSYPLVYLVIILFALYILLYLFSSYIPLKFIKKKNFFDSGISLKIKIFMIVVSTIEWFGATLLIWYFGNEIIGGLNFSEVLFFFSVGISIGIISPIPSGIGIFDLIMILGLSNLGFSSTEGTAVVLLFRIFYYLIPFILSILFVVIRLTINNKYFIEFSHLNYMKNKLRLNDSQIEIIKDVFAVAFHVLIIISSMVLIFSAITPTLPERIKILQVFFTIPAMQFSQKTTLTLGLILFILSYEIKLRVKRAHSFSILLLVLGSLFTIIKGYNIEESILLLVISGILIFTKDYFYRISIPFSWIRIGYQMIFSEVFIILYMLSGQKNNYSFYKMHKGIELLNSTPDNYKDNAIFISFILQGFIIIWNLLNWFYSLKDLPWLSQTKKGIFEQLEKVLTQFSGNVLTHLIYIGDKYIYKSEKLNLLVSFRPFQNNFVVLGDPIGEVSNIFEFLEEFRYFADLYGYVPVYYQVDEKYLSYYHDSGYTFFKLGEEALIELENFSLVSKAFRGFRSTKNRLEKEGYKFYLSKEPHSEKLLNEIEEVSKEWLGNKKEKGFSLGNFDREYINRSPIAILSDSSNRIIAFATIMPTYNNDTISVDLMRFRKNSPNGTMDFLFLKLFEWAKDLNYMYFYMGMAPLSNVGMSRFARKEEKLAKLVYASRKTTYNFKGLRNYKEKFHPEWRGKYLAYPSYVRAESVLLNISMMISSFHKKIKK